jgi:hypothetical protein
LLGGVVASGLSGNSSTLLKENPGRARPNQLIGFWRHGRPRLIGR